MAEVLQSIPCSQYTQGNKFITCPKQFLDDLEDFITKKKKVWNDIKKNLPTFVDLLKYVTGDIMIENDKFTKIFMECLDNSDSETYLKSLTSRHRKLKSQIMEVLEGESSLCDYKYCMKFFSELLGCNITVITHDTYKSSIDSKFDKNLHVFVENDGTFDYAFKSELNPEKKYGEYLSKKLADDMTIADLRELYMKINKVCVRGLTKKQILEKLK